ncbi:MAG: TRAP transporter substrate-binding protein DctP [Clostridia bacterium]
MKLRNIALLILVLLAATFSYGQTLNFKLAIDTPRNSPWGQSLERMAADWKRVSSGKVNLTVYAGTQGSDAQIIQKMRFGLDMGVFASTGLALVYDDILALSIPSLVRDETELRAVMKELDPSFRRGLAEKGYSLVAYSYSGWVRMFSRRPVANPADLVGLKVAVMTGDTKISRMLQSVGAIPVQVDGQGFVGQIATGAIDALLFSPALVQAQWSFLKTYIPYMTDFKVSPFIGAIIMNARSWERIPAATRPLLVESADRLSADMAREIDRLEEAAIRAMSADGMTVVTTTEADKAAWYESFVSNRDRFVAAMFSKDVVDAVDRVISARETP